MPQNEPQTQKAAPSTTKPGQPLAAFAETGKERAEQIFKLQAEFSKYLQEANKTWLARLQSEASLASQLASELAAARSIPETTTAWQHWTKRRIELFAEDSRRLLADTEKLMETGGRMLGNGWAPRP
jgi:hypothetical protein